MLFDVDEPDGIAQLAPADAKKRDDTVELYAICAQLARDHFKGHDPISTKRWITWEGPVKRGLGSPYAIPGHERHTSSFEMTVMVDLIHDLHLEPTMDNLFRHVAKKLRFRAPVQKVILGLGCSLTYIQVP